MDELQEMMVMSFKMLQLPFIFAAVPLSVYQTHFPQFQSKRFNSTRTGDKSPASLLYFTYLDTRYSRLMLNYVKWFGENTLHLQYV